MNSSVNIVWVCFFSCLQSIHIQSMRDEWISNATFFSFYITKKKKIEPEFITHRKLFRCLKMSEWMVIVDVLYRHYRKVWLTDIWMVIIIHLSLFLLALLSLVFYPSSCSLSFHIVEENTSYQPWVFHQKKAKLDGLLLFSFAILCIKNKKKTMLVFFLLLLLLLLLLILTQQF